MKNFIRRCVAATTISQLAISAFAQSWNLVWREDFGVAEDTVVKNFDDPRKTVPNHYFIDHDKVQIGYDNVNNKPLYEYKKREPGNEECGLINDDFYGIANSTIWATKRPKKCNINDQFFYYGRDHTGNDKGAMLIINAGGEPGDEIYTQDIDFDLCDSKTYRFGLYTATITKFDVEDNMKGDLTLQVFDRNSGNIIKELRTGPIPQWVGASSYFAEQKWYFYSFEFTVSGRVDLTLKVINNNASGSGNDFVVDDISLWRYDEDVELPELNISESAIASQTGGNCSYNAIYTIPEDIMKVWRTVDNSVYVLWQKSNNGYEWISLDEQSGIEKSKLSLAIDGSESPSFRVIVTASPTAAEAKAQAIYIAENGGPMDGCAYYAISPSLASIKPEPNCKYKEDLKTVWKEDFGVCDTFDYKTNSGMVLQAYIPGGQETMQQNGSYIICSIPDSVVYHMSCDWSGNNCKKEIQFSPGSWQGDASMFRLPEVGNAFAFIRMSKNENKADPTVYKKTLSLPFCPCKTYMFNGAVMTNGSQYGTPMVVKMAVYDKSGNELSSESVPLNFVNGFSKQIASVPFSVPTGYSGDITVEMALDYNYNENGISCADYSDFAIDDLSITICGEVMEKPTLSIDGNSSLTLLSGFECTDETPHSVILAGMDNLIRDYPNASFIWQSSVDGGNTWDNISATTTSIAYEGEPEILYRVVIGESSAVAEEVARNGKPADGCSIFFITNEVGFQCKESGCRAPKFSLDSEEKVLTIDSVFCDTPDAIDIEVFQTNRVNVDDFYIAEKGTGNSYGVASVLTPAPTSTDGKWTLSLEKKSGEYMIYAMNDTCKSDTFYVNVDIREKLELKPIEDQIFCANENPSIKIEVQSGKASNVYLKSGSLLGTANIILMEAQVPFVDDAKTIGEREFSAYVMDADEKCVSEKVNFKIDYEDIPVFTFSSDATKVCKGEMAELKLDITPTHNSENHIYEIVGSDGNTVDLDDLFVSPTQLTTYTVTATSEVCNTNKTETLTIDVDLPQAIDLSTVPSPELQTTLEGNIVCAPANVSFEVSGDNLTTWNWEYRKKGERDFSAWEARSTSTSNSIEITEETSFRVSAPVVSTNDCGNAISEIITIKAEKKTEFTLALDNERVCESGDVELSIVTTDSYDADKVVATANGSPITLTNGKYKSTITTDTEYSVEIKGNVCRTTPQTINATIDYPLNFTASVDKDLVCKGSDVEFTLTGETTGLVWYSSTNGTDFESFSMPSTLKWRSDTTRYFYASSPENGVCEKAVSETLKVVVERSLDDFELSWIKPKHEDLLCKNVSAQFGFFLKKGIPTDVDAKFYVDGVLYTPTEVFHDYNGDENYAPFIYKVKIPHTKKATYKIEVTGKVCHVGNPKTSSYTVAVEELPEVSLLTTTPIICEGEQVNLTPTLINVKDTAIRYYQEVDGVRTQITSFDNLTPTKNTTYYISGGGVRCQSVTSVGVPVEVDPKIDFELTSDVNGVVCEGTPANVNLKINSGNIVRQTFLANNVPDSYDIVTNNTYSVMPTEPTTYELTLEGKVCRAPSKNLVLNIEKKPTLSVTINKDGICEGEFVTITPTATNAPSLVWEFSVDGENFNADGSSNSEETRNPSVTTTYRISTAGKTTCPEQNWSQKVEVEPAFNVSFVDNNAIACPGEEVDVVADITGLSNDLKVEWNKSLDNSKFQKITTNDHTTLKNIKLDTTTIFKVKVSGKYCKADSAITTALVDVVPTMTLEATNDSLCEGDEITLTSKYTSNNFDESSIVMKNGEDDLANGQQALIFTPTESMDIKVAAMTPAGCVIKPSSIKLFVDPTISLNVPDDTTLCEGGEVKFFINSNKGYRYTWSVNDEILSNNSKFSYDGNESVNVKLEAVSKVCKEIYDIAINVVPTPHIVSVEESGANRFEFEVEGGNGAYQFDFGNGFQSSSILEPATYGRTYRISVKDELGCKSDTSIVTPTYELEVPTSFTPNGDGIDDVWYVKNLDKYPSASIRLYDRYGKKLCDMTSAEMESWDGTYRGKELPSTDYWYEIEIDEIDKTYVGHFTLIRGKD